ncbi:MAG: YceD family protein [Sulfuricaulis sp.]
MHVAIPESVARSFTGDHRPVPAGREGGARLTGTLPLTSMPRLAQNCQDSSGRVHVDLVFERGEGEEVFLMHGSLRANLHVTCQRCLEDMDLMLEASPWFILARSGKSQDMLDEEPDILVADKHLSLSALVEDELLLTLPMVPMHALNQCPAGEYIAARADPGLPPAKAGVKSPFSVLSRMKKTR